MPLQGSGQISLDDIHVEAGGTSGTQAAVNDSDIRALINASSATEIEFADFYNASGAAEFKWARTDTDSNDHDDINFGNVTLMSPSIAVGDLVVVAVSSDGILTPTPTVSGMTMTAVSTVESSSPGHYVLYGFRQSGDSNFITFNGSPTGTAISAVMAVFSGVSSLTNSNQRTKSSGMPDPATLSGASPTKLFVATAHLDDDPINMTAPSGYTLAGATNFSGTSDSSTAIAYKISTSTADENVGAFGGGGNDNNRAFLMRFG